MLNYKQKYFFFKFTRQSRALLTQATIPDVKIRQCLCSEQHDCLEEMSQQAIECSENCWHKFNKVKKNAKFQLIFNLNIPSTFNYLNNILGILSVSLFQSNLS